MTETTNSESEDAREALRKAFPDWSIVHTSDTGRWWAFRTPRTRRRLLDGALLGEHQVTDVDADTPEGLRRKLREATATLPDAGTGTAANPARAPQS